MKAPLSSRNLVKTDIKEQIVRTCLLHILLIALEHDISIRRQTDTTDIKALLVLNIVAGSQKILSSIHMHKVLVFWKDRNRIIEIWKCRHLRSFCCWIRRKLLE